MGHGQAILSYSTVQPMGHGAHTPSYGPWVMGICTCRTATYGPWVMGFCHAVWPMTHGEKVAETCVGKPPELENGSRVVVPRYLAVIMIPVTVPA